MDKGFKRSVVVIRNTIVPEPPLFRRPPDNQYQHHQLAVKMEMEDHHHDWRGKMRMEVIVQNNCVEINDSATRPCRPTRRLLRRGE